MDVALAATLHDPAGALEPLLRRQLPTLRRLYGPIAVATTPATARRVDALLDAQGVFAGRTRVDARGPVYRLALRRALASGAGRVQYLDFDRALHWVATRPTELAAVLRGAAAEPALVVGRTVAAHRSHHRPLVATERAVNRAFAVRLGVGGRFDVLVPSFVLSRDLARTLLRCSRARDADIYGEWPAILATLAPSVAYVECDGLDWETPDRHAAEVRRLGLAAWRRTFDAPAEWRVRRAMAAAFVRGFRAMLGRRRVALTVRRVRLDRRARDYM